MGNWKNGGVKPPRSVRRASALADESPGIKIGLYGDAGSGKTAVSCRGGGATNDDEVLVLLAEPHGIATIRVWNLDAAVAMVTEAAELRSWVSLLASSPCGVDERGAYLSLSLDNVEVVVRRVVLDSFTEIQRILVDEILSGERRESLTLQEWGLLNDRSIDLIRTVRNLPVDVCVIFLAESNDGSDQRYIKPLVKGRKLPNECAQFFSAFGYCYRQQEDDDLNYRVLFGGSDNYITKQATGLDRVEEPGFDDWRQKMITATPEAAALAVQATTDDDDNQPAKPKRRRRSMTRSD
jgi:hypothetical protein